jgi:hypothetical protein
MLTIADVLHHAKITGLLEKPYSYKIEPMNERNEFDQELYKTFLCNRSWSNFLTIEDIDDEIETISTYRNIFEKKWILFTEKKPPHNEYVLLSVKGRIIVGHSYTHPSCATMYEAINHFYISEGDIDAWMPIPSPYGIGGEK